MPVSKPFASELEARLAKQMLGGAEKLFAWGKYGAKKARKAMESVPPLDKAADLIEQLFEAESAQPYGIVPDVPGAGFTYLDNLVAGLSMLPGNIKKAQKGVEAAVEGLEKLVPGVIKVGKGSKSMARLDPATMIPVRGPEQAMDFLFSMNKKGEPEIYNILTDMEKHFPGLSNDDLLDIGKEAAQYAESPLQFKAIVGFMATEKSALSTEASKRLSMKVSADKASLVIPDEAKSAEEILTTDPTKIDVRDLSVSEIREKLGKDFAADVLPNVDPRVRLLEKGKSYVQDWRRTVAGNMGSRTAAARKVGIHKKALWKTELPPPELLMAKAVETASAPNISSNLSKWKKWARPRFSVDDIDRVTAKHNINPDVVAALKSYIYTDRSVHEMFRNPKRPAKATAEEVNGALSVIFDDLAELNSYKFENRVKGMAAMEKELKDARKARQLEQALAEKAEKKNFLPPGVFEKMTPKERKKMFKEQGLLSDILTPEQKWRKMQEELQQSGLFGAPKK